MITLNSYMYIEHCYYDTLKLVTLYLNKYMKEMYAKQGEV